MDFYLTAILLGLGYSCLAMGIYISMRIFNIPDITTDGSFTLGGAVTAVMMNSNYSQAFILPVVFLAGAGAGAITGFIHTKLRVNALLAGILVMTSLYSINLAIMGRSNIPLTGLSTIFNISGFTEIQGQLLILSLFIVVLFIGLSLLLKTDFGLTMRATGNNENMMRSLGSNTTMVKITGIALANGLTALSGYLICQVQGFADIGMGIGIVILGLGSVMIGEIFLKIIRVKNIAYQLAGVIAGTIIFRMLLAFALSIGINPLYLKLVVALFVLIVVSLPNLKTQE